MPPDPPAPDLCQPGTFSVTGEEPCTPAPPGKFVDTEGATEAVDCAPGFFQDQAGQTSCIAAPPGSFVAASGAASAALCAVGEFQPNAGSTSCLIAPVGTYVDVTGAAAAIDCPPGETSAPGSTSASDCVTEVVLAVAYSNLDGVNGFDPSGTDVLIAKLIDLNLDMLAGAGDLVVTSQYPLDFGASAFGNFQTTAHLVDGALADSATLKNVVDGAGNRFAFDSNASLESYLEIVPSGSNRVSMDDRFNPADQERVVALSDAPSAPGTDVIEFRTGSATDDAFVDVDIF